MNLGNLNLNHLRVFEAVCRTKSMTKAAQELFLTQSGVSQNIRALEDVLGQKLFDRFKGRLIATSNAQKLFTLVQGQLFDLEQELSALMGEDLALRGTIHIGVPIEYGNRFVMPLASSFAKEHPLVDFKFSYGHVMQMNQQLIDGELDFAIADDFGLSSQIDVEDLDYEVHLLCGHKSYLEQFEKVNNSFAFLKELDYIAYLDTAPVLKAWFHFHFGREFSNIKMRATLMDVQGVAQLIKNGLGVGILPYHVVESIQSDDLHLFKGSGYYYKNTLRIATLKGKTHSHVALSFIEVMKNELRLRQSSVPAQLF